MEPVPNRAPKFDPATSFHEIQIRKEKGGKWTTKYSFQGDGLNAAKYYQGLNIGKGYRKRFVVDGKVTHTTTYSPMGE
jgi:hypothetical protein